MTELSVVFLKLIAIILPLIFAYRKGIKEHIISDVIAGNSNVATNYNNCTFNVFMGDKPK